MTIDTLEDLYIEQLNDVYSANQQALSIAKDFVQAATDQYLSEALASGIDGIQSGVLALEKIAIGHDESLDGAHCDAMEGLVKVARAHAVIQAFSEYDTKDAMVIIQYQRLVHHVIAGYGCLAAFADRLELDQDLIALQKCLDVSQSGDRRMTDLAAGGINRGLLG